MIYIKTMNMEIWDYGRQWLFYMIVIEIYGEFEVLPEKFENNWDRNPGPKKNRLKFDPNSEYDIRWDFYIFENSIAG